MTTQPYLPKNAGPVDWIGPESYPYAVSGLIHCVQLPRDADPDNLVPAIVMVHGWGGNESVMWIFKQTLPPNVAVITPRAPLDLGEAGYAWYLRDEVIRLPDPTTQRKAITQLEHFVTALPELYPVDPNRFLLMGFSQGGAIINNLVMSRPVLAMGVASLAGFIPRFPDSLTPVDSLAGFPVFIAHGTRDEIVPLSAARQTRERYEQLGAAVTYGEYDVGHKMNVKAMNDLKAWLAKVIGA